MRNGALALLVIADPERNGPLAQAQFTMASNMNDKLAALGALLRAPGDMREPALAEFEHGHAEDPLILDKWFALQARIPEPGDTREGQGPHEHPRIFLRQPEPHLRAV